MTARSTINNTAAQTTGYYAAFFVLGAVIASLGPTVPFLAENTSVGLEIIGTLFTARSLGYLIGSLLSGRLYDRLPGHRLQSVALSAAMLALIITPLVTQFWFLALVMLIIGLSEGTIDVGANTLLVWIHGTRSGPYLNGMFLVAGLGGFLSPLFIGNIMSVGWDERFGYWGIALINLPVLLWLILFPSPARRVDVRRGGGMRWWPFAVYCVLVFLYIGGEVGISGWIYTYILQNDLANAPTAAKINSLYWLGITMGRLASIPLAARFRIANLVTGNLAGVLAAVSLLLFFPHTLSAVWISAFLIGLFVAAIFPMTFAYLEQQTPVTGSRAGILWASGSFGAMLLPWWMGTLLRVSGPQVFPISLLTVWGAATVLFVVIVKINTRN